MVRMIKALRKISFMDIIWPTSYRKKDIALILH